MSVIIPLLCDFRLKLKLVKPVKPVFAPEGGEATVEFSSNFPVVLSAKLAVQKKGSQGSSEELERDYVFITYPTERSSQLQLQFPYAGVYAISVFGRKREVETSTLPMVYKLVAVVDLPKVECTPFPQTFGVWGPGQLKF